MTLPCSLKIRTPNFKLQLEGNADFVQSSYQAVKREVLIHLGDTLTLPLSTLSEDDPSQPAQREPGGSLDAIEAGPDQYVWVYHCGELYNKVHVTQRTVLGETALGGFVHPSRVARIYLEGADTQELRRLVPTGKTLWSELTMLGRQRLRQR